MKMLAREIKAVLLGTAVLALPLTASALVADGHLAMWSFNRDLVPPAMTATTITDKSGKGNNGTSVEGIPIYTMSVGGSSDFGSSWWNSKNSEVAHFYGSNSFQVSETAAATSTALRLNASPFTISAWTQVMAYGEVSTQARPIVSKPGWNLSISMDLIPYTSSVWVYNTDTNGDGIPDDGDGDGEPDWWDGHYESVVSTMLMGSAKFCSGTTCVQSPFLPELEPYRWANVAVTYDSVAKKATLYVNGVQQAVSGPTPAFPAPAATAGPLLVGKSQDGTSFFSGMMDDVRIYNRVLSSVATATAPNEIRELGKGCAPATFTPSTGKVIVPCVAVTTYYPPAYYYAELQQAISVGGDVNVPAIDDISFGIPVAPKAIVATPTNPEPVWGSGVAAYSGSIYYGQPLEFGTDRYLLSGWLNLPRVSVVDAIANPKTQCYGVYLDQIFANNRFVLVDYDGLSHLGPDCDAVYYYGSVGQQGAASGEDTKPKPHREIPEPRPVQ